MLIGQLVGLDSMHIPHQRQMRVWNKWRSFSITIAKHPETHTVGALNHLHD